MSQMATRNTSTAREWRAAWLLFASYFFLATQFLGAVTAHHERLGIGADGRVVICSAMSVAAGTPADEAGHPASLVHCEGHEGLCSAFSADVADQPMVAPPTARLVFSESAMAGATTSARRSIAHQHPPSRAPPA
jgi:hypothetical protein